MTIEDLSIFLSVLSKTKPGILLLFITIILSKTYEKINLIDFMHLGGFGKSF